MTQYDLDPQLGKLLEQRKKTGILPMYAVSPEQARQGAAKIRELGGTLEPLAKIQDLNIPGSETKIPARIYTPYGEDPFPIMVLFHGGGWVIGNLDTHEPSCRAIANRASCIVVSVDYRLSPEYKFPAALNDAYDATLWAQQHAREINGDPERLGVGGDSAGGNLATVLCHLARDRGKPDIILQLLNYPVTDLSSFDRASYNQYGEDIVLTKKTMVYCAEQYLGNKEDGMNPLASPLLAEDLTGLPPAHIVLAEFDVLNDEILAYSERLKNAGVAVTVKTYKGMIHPFLSYGGVVHKTIEALDDIAGVLRSVFNA
jgi:acetyl esterase